MGTRDSLLGRELDHDSLFVRLSEEFCDVLARHDIPLRPYESRDLRLFSRLSPDLRAIILAGLEESLATWTEAESDGESLFDSAGLLRRTLSRLKLAPQPDIFEKIAETDIVEVFTTEFRQIFGNLNFFRYFTCTLEELVAIPRPDLVSRPSETMEYFRTVFARLSRNELTRTFEPPIGPYEIDERVGAGRLRHRIRIKYVSPVLENGRGVALIAVSEGAVISRGA